MRNFRRLNKGLLGKCTWHRRWDKAYLWPSRKVAWTMKKKCYAGARNSCSLKKKSVQRVVYIYVLFKYRAFAFDSETSGTSFEEESVVNCVEGPVLFLVCCMYVLELPSFTPFYYQLLTLGSSVLVF
jgi:hypothetical protein